MRASTLAVELLGSSLARYRSSLLSAALSIGVIAFALVAVAQASSNSASRDDGLSSEALRTVTLDSYGQSTNPQAVTLGSIDAIRAYPQVTSAGVATRLQIAPVGNPSAAFDGVVFVYTPRYAAVQPPLIDGDEPIAQDEILMADDLAEEAGLATGSAIQIEHIVTNADGTREGVSSVFIVSGLYDSSVHGLDPEFTVYGTVDGAVDLIADEQGQPHDWVRAHHTFLSGYVTVETLDDVAPLVEQLIGEGYGATAVTTLVTGANQTLRFLTALAPILALLGLAVVVSFAWSVASSLALSHRNAIGVLRALGWSKREVRMSFMLHLLLVGAWVGALACAAFAVLALLGMGLAFVTDFGWLEWMPSPAWSWVLVLVAVPVVGAAIFAIAPLPVVRRLARIPVDQVLRDVPA